MRRPRVVSVVCTLVSAGSLLAVIAAFGLPTSLGAPSGETVGNGKIAFDRAVDTGPFEVAVMNPDGSSVTVLTAGFGFARFPAWSPDGSKIAFSGETETSDQRGIFVMNGDGTKVTNIHSNGSVPAWSPDGSQIVFWDGPDMWVMNADGSNANRIYDDLATVHGLAWSPDGSQVAFMRSHDGNYDVYVAQVDGTSEPFRLTTSPEFDGDPDWSPDGSRIAFSSYRDGYGAIYIMNADGNDQRPLIAAHRCASPTPTPGPEETPRQCPGDEGPAWSPDGTLIAYSSLGPSGEIVIADTDGGGALTGTGVAGSFPDWQPLVNSAATPAAVVTPPAATESLDPGTPEPCLEPVASGTAIPTPTQPTETTVTAKPDPSPQASETPSSSPEPAIRLECLEEDSDVFGAQEQALALVVLGVVAAGSAVGLPVAAFMRRRR